MSALVKNIFVASVVSAVIAAVIGGIVLLGSPAKERMRKLDVRRVDSLRTITNALSVYWTRHKSLPPSLDALAREPGVLLKPLDPETGQPYEYKATSEKNYELCAQFALDTAEEQDSIRKEFWSHGPGRQCFHFQAREAKQ